MRNLKIIIFLLMILIFTTGKVFANEGESTNVISQNEVELNIKNDNKLKINVTEPVKQIDGKLFKSKEEMMSQYFQIQKKMDVADIKVLWESTIDRNPIIKFALKKLAMPAEQRRVHSSIMAKTVGTLISGAAILPGLLGADPLTSSVSSASGTIANRVIASNKMPKQMPLTDTELIHLARLVEDLQDRMIKNYYEYKSDLEALKIARQEVLKQKMAYSVAIRANEPIAIMTAKVMYDNALKDEMSLMREVKTHRLELERLAGSDTLNNLMLGKILISDVKEKPISLLPPLPDLQVLPSLSRLNTSIYLDKSVNELAQEAGSELKDDKSSMLSDLNILWNAAVERNETIRFAILKLSNPDGKVEKTSSVKKILSPLTSVASMIGAGVGDPVAATSAVIGGGMLNSLLSSDNAELNAHLAKVTDSDLVLLAQETDNLQNKLVNLYCDYMGALADLNYVDQVLNNRKNYYESIQKKSSDLKAVANVFYNESISDQYKARQKVLNTRVALEQFVGNEALISVDKSIKQRLSMH
ncbi:MAG TPA: hypothetical protein DDW90_07305 [Cyanobacteria bacterium UBA9971]|nr:hypothetical protein [Cyanobacteria bacterium UBA9971]